MKAPKLNVKQIYFAPAALACVTFIGLISALIGDGFWDGVSWAGLSVPLIAIAYFLWRAWVMRRCNKTF